MNKQNPKEDIWGSCENGSDCTKGSTLATDESEGNLAQFVGKDTVDSLEYGCKCKDTGKYGPYCSWDEPDDSARNFCGYGRYNIGNYVSGCECRDASNAAVPYHGWYCDIHNKLLCDNSKFYKNTFYDVNFMDTSKVAHVYEPCRSCDAFMENCGECQQDKETECKWIYMMR